MKILLIKLGALGDVLRTTPLLQGLQKKYPQCRITWVVDEKNKAVLEGNEKIDNLESLSPGHGDWKKTRYDVAINLDKEPEALEALEGAKAAVKMGFGRRRDGSVCPVNELSQYAYRLGLDDDLKFRLNQKTYQQISFEQVGLSFQGEEYDFYPGAQNMEMAKFVLKQKGLDVSKKHKPVIGLNTGSGNRFAGKKLSAEQYKLLSQKLYEAFGATVCLLGGEDEKDKNAWIEKHATTPILNTGSHDIQVFAGIVKACDLIVTGDTTAMHIAIAMKVPVLAHFASTCAAEIELYGRGKKIVSEMICAPCYKRICPIDEKCVADMDLDQIVHEVGGMLRDYAICVS